MPALAEAFPRKITPAPHRGVLLGVWAGLAGGLGEALLLLIARYGFHRLVFRGLDVLWMAPLKRFGNTVT
ncbi:MAG TPA: hypothetical protein VGQ73_01265 [Gemmatimonadales bacterium]|nr:hypothetical protein [Gemmatimonadales bacterium]